MNKKGILGEGIVMIYRLLLVAFIAFIILGVSSVFYAHSIDVRDAEAIVLSRQVANCLTQDDSLDLDSLLETEKNSVLSYCGYENSETERFYVRTTFFTSEEVSEPLGVLEQGDSGKLWVRGVFMRVGDKLGADEIGLYEPGYASEVYPVMVINSGSKIDSQMKVEALVNYE